MRLRTAVAKPRRAAPTDRGNDGTCHGKTGDSGAGTNPPAGHRKLFTAYLPGTELIVQGALDGLAADAIDDLARQKETIRCS